MNISEEYKKAIRKDLHNKLDEVLDELLECLKVELKFDEDKLSK